MNQALSKPSVSFLETGPNVIEIMSSDGEDNPQSPQSPQSPLIQTSSLPSISQTQPGGLRQATHMRRSPGLPDLTPIPPEGSLPLPSQLPEVSSPHEVENMMDVDDTVQHSSPFSPPPSLPLYIPQVNHTVDAIERTLSNVTVSSPPIHQAHPPHAFEPIEDSEPEGGPSTEDNHDVDGPQGIPIPSVENIIAQNPESDDGFHSPPPPSSSSPSHHISLSSTPIVRCLLYGGPNGIFRDANTSIMQHIQATSLQTPSASDTVAPHVPNPPHGLAQVKNTFSVPKCYLTLFLGFHSL